MRELLRAFLALFPSPSPCAIVSCFMFDFVYSASEKCIVAVLKTLKEMTLSTETRTETVTLL